MSIFNINRVYMLLNFSALRYICEGDRGCGRPKLINLKNGKYMMQHLRKQTNSYVDFPVLAPLQELVSAGPSQQNWKSIGIALLVIGGVIGLIALSVYTLTEDDLGKRIKGDRIRLNDIVDSSFRPRTFNGTWISGSKLIFASPGGGGVSILDVASGETKNLMSNSTFVSIELKVQPLRIIFLPSYLCIYYSMYSSSSRFTIFFQRQLNSQTFFTSPDLEYVMIPFNKNSVFRHSYKAQYALYSVNSR